MKGPCESPSPHGWTLDTLEEFLTSKIKALSEFTSAESRASKEAVSAALAAVKEQSAAAMTAAEKAINKAELATEKRFEGVNEFRDTLSDQAATFLARTEYISGHKVLEEKMNSLDRRIVGLETEKTTKTEGISLVGQIVIGLISIVSTITAVVTLIFVITRGH